MPKYGVFSGPYFPALGLNTERYFVSLRIQSECGKIHTRKNSVFGHFSRSDSQISRYALIVLVPAAWQYDTNSYKILDKKIKKMREGNCLQVNIVLGLTLIILRKENL